MIYSLPYFSDTRYKSELSLSSILKNHYLIPMEFYDMICINETVLR